MPSNHKASNETAAAVTAQETSALSSESTDLDGYAQQAKLPIYAAPVVPSLSFPLIQYAKGVTVVSGKKPTKMTSYMIETDQSAELDAIFEQWGASELR